MKKLILLFVFIISNESPNLLTSNEFYKETKKNYNILEIKFKSHPLGYGKLIKNIISNTMTQ